MENLQAQQVAENNPPPVELPEIKEQSVIAAYKANRYDLLKDDKEKVINLAVLISDSLPTKIIKEQTALVIGKDDKNLDFFDEQIKLEKLYTVSFLTDILNKKPSAITDVLKSYLVLSYQEKTKNNHYGVMTNEMANQAIVGGLEMPIKRIAQSLELGKEKSFVESLLH